MENILVCVCVCGYTVVCSVVCCVGERGYGRRLLTSDTQEEKRDGTCRRAEALPTI